MSPPPILGPRVHRLSIAAVSPPILGSHVHRLSIAAVSPSFWVSTMISCFFFALCEKKREVRPRIKYVSFSFHEFAPGMHASMFPSFGLASERREGPLCQGSETAHRETGGSRRRSRTSRLPVNSRPGLCSWTLLPRQFFPQQDEMF